jgi:hypothetical protein
VSILILRFLFDKIPVATWPVTDKRKEDSMVGSVAIMHRIKRNDLAVKIEAEVVRMAKTMCSYNDTTVAEYLSGILRGPVTKDFEKFKKEIASQKEPK